MSPTKEDLRALAIVTNRFIASAWPLEFSLVDGEDQREEIFTQRAEVVNAQGWSEGRRPVLRDTDSFDTRATLVQGRVGGRLMASARILWPDDGALPVEQDHQLDLALHGLHAEVGRVIVSRNLPTQRSGVLQGLLSFCVEQLALRRIYRIAAGANQGMQRLYRRLGFECVVLGDSRHLHGDDRCPVSIDVIRSAYNTLEQWRRERLYARMS